MEVVDEWYRLSREDGLDLERKSPELYTYAYASNWSWDYVYNSSKKASKLMGQIFFTKFPNWDGLTQMMFANQFAPDHRSGKA